jgi:PleD family two-component response regulator
MAVMKPVVDVRLSNLSAIHACGALATAKLNLEGKGFERYGTDKYTVICVNLRANIKRSHQGMGNEHGNLHTIFLVEEDDETRHLLKHSLIRQGYRVIIALDEEDAMERVGSGSANADLLLVNLVGKSPEDALDLGRRIREHAKYDGHTPLVVMAEKYGEDLEGRDVNVDGNDWITYPEDSYQIENLLRRLLARISDQ